MNNNKNAKLIYNNREVELDVLHGSVGPSVIDIRKLYGELGCFTYDPGYGATGSCESAKHILMEKKVYCYIEDTLLKILQIKVLF